MTDDTTVAEGTPPDIDESPEPKDDEVPGSVPEEATEDGDEPKKEPE
jgi:hypothetical protein